ncbi:DJ-1/PfpI family protein [Sphingosinicella terrae]|uniref:DJ-1/PfpI family protein n=1 Tax=Sphingosinicella terrae TaxID=2172047 RepID=UPI000E0D5534|nr:DJ-1/PfpI family protein [Sphingosinicella terrae]
MNRRDLIKGSLGGAALALAGSRALALVQDRFALPARETVRVAFLLGEGTNMIDTAGPWEVFQDSHAGSGSEMRMPFELFTVAPDLEERRMTGGFHTRAHFSFAAAPQPHVIVVPAHRGSEASLAWLREASRGADITLSVCTGAFQLARAGLLEGYPVTTHHDFWDSFAREFPGLDLRRGPRFIDSGRIATAGGLTSGIDLALHVVSRYFGVAAAAATATYMEYSSEAWRAS